MSKVQRAIDEHLDALRNQPYVRRAVLEQLGTGLYENLADAFGEDLPGEVANVNARVWHRPAQPGVYKVNIEIELAVLGSALEVAIERGD